MVTNFTSNSISSTYTQILHVDGGPEATEKTIYSAAGVATAVKIGTGSASVDNVRFDGNTISTLNTDGNLELSPNGTGTVNIANVAITGGAISGITDLAIADGGTGASDAAGARTNLGLGSIATQAADSVAITGGVITGAALNGTFSGTTSFLVTTSIGYTTGNGGTVTQATSRTTGVTLNAPSGQITLFADTIAGLTSQKFTLTNSYIAATDVVLVCFSSGLTEDTYAVTVAAVSAGACDIVVHNVSNTITSSDAPVVNFVVLKGVAS